MLFQSIQMSFNKGGGTSPSRFYIDQSRYDCTEDKQIQKFR